MSRRAVPLSLVLLGLMTVAILGGPLGFGAVLRGGRSPSWPPDRAVEWVMLGATSALVVILMVATIAVSLRERGAGRREG
jgi:hypothetical protein